MAQHNKDLSHLYGNINKTMIAITTPVGLLNAFKVFGRAMPPSTEEGHVLISKTELPVLYLKPARAVRSSNHTNNRRQEIQRDLNSFKRSIFNTNHQFRTSLILPKS